MESPHSIQSSLPSDIALKIASYLQVLDVCVLGSCSRFWRELCGSDYIWESLTRDRWPSASFIDDSSSSSTDPTIKGWREIYRRMHREMAVRATSVVKLVEQCSSSESIEAWDYSKAIKALCSMQLGFGDIQLFFFKPDLSVLVNLVGLHYCILCLKVPAGNVMDALLNCKISERQVHVKWWKLGRWFYGFRMRDESHLSQVSLADLTTVKGEEVLGVLRRGPVHEVLRIEISTSNATSAPWSCRQD